MKSPSQIKREGTRWGENTAYDLNTAYDKAGGIKRMITARLGVKPSDKLWEDGTTMEKGVKEIYSDGRSRTIHGTNDQLGHDWSSLRAGAEGLARLCLIVCMEWASHHAEQDDPSSSF